MLRRNLPGASDRQTRRRARSIPSSGCAACLIGKCAPLEPVVQSRLSAGKRPDLMLRVQRYRRAEGGGFAHRYHGDGVASSRFSFSFGAGGAPRSATNAYHGKGGAHGQVELPGHREDRHTDDDDSEDHADGDDVGDGDAGQQCVRCQDRKHHDQAGDAISATRDERRASSVSTRARKLPAARLIRGVMPANEGATATTPENERDKRDRRLTALRRVFSMLARPGSLVLPS